MATSIAISLGGTGTTGYSPSAEFIRDKIRSSLLELHKPEFYFSVLKKVLPELIEVKNQTAEAGWDGYSANPIGTETFARAYTLLEVLPNHIPPPTVGAEPDGDITLEWYHSPHRTLSVSISTEGDLHYAALIGPNKAYGTEVFYGEAPIGILDLIRRVYAG